MVLDLGALGPGELEANKNPSSTVASHSASTATATASASTSAASSDSALAAASSATKAASNNEKDAIVEAHHIVVCLGESKVRDWWSHSDNEAATTRTVMYNAFPADGREPHFFFGRSVLPMERGMMHEVSTRHDSTASAIRDPKVIHIKLHSKGVDSKGQYVELAKLTTEDIQTMDVGTEGPPMYAIVGLLAAAPEVNRFEKGGRTFELTTMLMHVLDANDRLHMIKVKMWGTPYPEAKKGAAMRAIGLTKSAFRDEISFEATKVCAITWTYKDPATRP